MVKSDCVDASLFQDIKQSGLNLKKRASEESKEKTKASLASVPHTPYFFSLVRRHSSSTIREPGKGYFDARNLISNKLLKKHRSDRGLGANGPIHLDPPLKTKVNLKKTTTTTTTRKAFLQKKIFFIFNLEPISRIPNDSPCADLQTSKSPLVQIVSTKSQSSSTDGSLYTSGSLYTTESTSAVAVEGSRMLPASVIVAIAFGAFVVAVIIGSAVSCYIWRNRRFSLCFSLTRRSK